jgi:antitoxin ParD1/3/4
LQIADIVNITWIPILAENQKMAHVLSAELQRLVEQELATGRYRSAEQVLVEAMTLLREQDGHLQRFHENIRRRVESLDQGEGIELDDDSLASIG